MSYRIICCCCLKGKVKIKPIIVNKINSTKYPVVYGFSDKYIDK